MSALASPWVHAIFASMSSAAKVFEQRSLLEVAQDLARAHKEADREIQQIYMVEDPSGREVRLVEVSGSVGYTGSVMPFRFAARDDLNVPYESVIILLNPEEKEMLDQKKLALPEAWGPSPGLIPIM